MKPSCKVILDALHRGEELSPMTSINRLGLSALSQRVGELRNKHLIDIRDRWAMSPRGGRYKIYFLPMSLRKPTPQTEIIVHAHVRRLLTGHEACEVDDQQSLFS